MSGVGDCRSDEGVIVGLIDGMIASARVVSRWLRENGAPAEQVGEALKDMQADEDVAQVARFLVEASRPGNVERLHAENRELLRRLADQERFNAESRKSICEQSDRYKAERDVLSARLQVIRDWATADHGGVKRPIDIWPGLAAAVRADGTVEQVQPATAEALAPLDASLGTPGDEKPQPSEAGVVPPDCARCDGERRARLPFPASLCALFIVCPECGNKRCPKASYHGHACTGSNNSGQPGSVYGTACTEPCCSPSGSSGSTE